MNVWPLLSFGQEQRKRLKVKSKLRQEASARTTASDISRKILACRIAKRLNHVYCHEPIKSKTNARLSRILCWEKRHVVMGGITDSIEPAWIRQKKICRGVEKNDR